MDGWMGWVEKRRRIECVGFFGYMCTSCLGKEVEVNLGGERLLNGMFGGG